MSEIHSEFYEWVMRIGDALSISILLGYFFASLPVVATALTIIWTAIRIYETCTVQNWRKRKK